MLMAWCGGLGLIYGQPFDLLIRGGRVLDGTGNPEMSPHQSGTARFLARVRARLAVSIQ